LPNTAKDVVYQKATGWIKKRDEGEGRKDARRMRRKEGSWMRKRRMREEVGRGGNILFFIKR